MSFKTLVRPADTFPYIRHDPSGYDELKRIQRIEMLCSFYDLGTNGLADSLASLLQDNLSVDQNLEALNVQDDFKLASTGEPVAVPVIFKDRWLYRVDLPVVLSRTITRRYNVLNVASAHAELITDVGITREIGVEQ